MKNEGLTKGQIDSMSSKARDKRKNQKFDHMHQSAQPEVRERIKSVPVRYKFGYLRAAVGDSSPREAIKQKCCECVGYESAPDAIGKCEIKACPLWQYRPFKDRMFGKDEVPF